MDDMEQKLGQILGNPQMMQQIMNLASSLENGQTDAGPREAPSLDPAMLGKLTGILGRTGIDNRQQALLEALGPYLSRDRVSRLERAMRAAKMARAASSFLGSGGMQLLTGGGRNV